ncbi:anaerobic glycerol-3-phosphate dehydrogenase subunit GlpC [Sansalvadorimonas sp. 2012CJ34-2]|uniref:Anaerobic glycerol-3-phosphate dehydrogenase subunit GlpC n=1 Tax=Parendozoicomonas callyspongiae TaxID=2942213 RepID=A0ABT0PJV2_9GAMM|nr:anaerobic glycerol-3-phosphate dehydrogenase subunit GlpC [Sansalvadorimonas sp. 2012CJ34-2]MCL6271669.1 anaerobic glycerol-3-phosphate dehydrogenase subunit GlpC [Sansalvadorimonas sp. 2012CJ34-2]
MNLFKDSDRSFDSCLKCTACSSRCPVASVRPDFPGPKQCGPDGERLRLKSPDFLDEALKYCTGCKRCEVACPSDVHISDIIADAKARYGKGNKFKIREFLLSHTDLMGTMTRGTAPIVNAVTKTKTAKVVMHKALGIDQRRQFPPYAHKSFRSWYKAELEDKQVFARNVSYFHGCFVNYNLPELGIDTIKVLNAMNIGVQLLKKEKCCGVPLVANGFHKKAKANARFNTDSIEQAIDSGSECVISTSSSCAFMLREDYPRMLGETEGNPHQQVNYITRFLTQEFKNGNKPELKPVNLRVGYHSPCHLIRSGGVLHTLSLLREIPGLQLHQLESNCCGIAGTYGFKKENYNTSQDIGEPLFHQIEEGEFDYIVTDCETCKMQIEMSTSAEVIHPVSLLARALDV